MNKSDITNIVTILIMALGYSNENDTLFMVGLLHLVVLLKMFWRIHMLFEKYHICMEVAWLKVSFTQF